MTLSKFGINCHHKMRGEKAPRDYSAEEKVELWRFFEEIQPATSLFMELDWARQAKRLVPGTAAIYRPERDTDWRTVSPQDYFNFNAPACDGGHIILNVLNEPHGYLLKPEDRDYDPDALKKLGAWCAETMNLFGRAGLPIVIPNWPVGHPDLARLGDLADLWGAISDWASLHYLSYHPYWTVDGLSRTDGRLMRWRDLLTFVANPSVRMIMTECGEDDPLDGRQGLRGYRTSKTGEAYAAVVADAIRNYFNHPQVVGCCLYVYGNTGGDRIDPARPGLGQDWWTFDVSHDEGFKRTIVPLLKAVPAPPEPPKPQLPPKPAPGDYILHRPPGESNVRSAPKRGDNILTEVRDGDPITVSGASVTADGYTWIAITTDIVFGWLALLDGMSFEAVPDEPPTKPAGQLTKDDVQLLVNHYERQAAEATRMAQFWIDFGNRLKSA